MGMKLVNAACFRYCSFLLGGGDLSETQTKQVLLNIEKGSLQSTKL